MDIHTAEKIAYGVMTWCAGVYGKSRYHDDYPMVFARYELDKKISCYGEYDHLHNVIIIYTKFNYKPLQLINTVIHEYIHYLQSPIWIARYMKVYNSRKEKNPYEVVATFIAQEQCKFCEKRMRRKIKRWLQKKDQRPNRENTEKKRDKEVVLEQKPAGKKVK